MGPRVIAIAAALATLLLLVGCEDRLSPYTGYLTEEINPCTPAPDSSVGPCGLQPTTMLVSQPWWITGLRIAFDIGLAGGIETNFRELDGIPPTMEQQLGAVGLNELRNSLVTHIVARATFLPGTERCTSDDPFRHAYYDEFLSDIFPSTSSSAIQCFADVRANSYILGKGPSQLTVQTGLYIYTPEQVEYLTDTVEGEESISAAEFVERFRRYWEYAMVHGDEQSHYETGSGPPTSVTFTGGIMGKEVVLFLGPSVNQATAAWQVFETWDVQRGNEDTVVAVHPHREAWKLSRNYIISLHGPLLEVELPRLRQEVAEANRARLEAFGGRIGADTNLPMLITDIHSLAEFMTSTGAYDHPEGTPLPPPPVPGSDRPDVP